MMIAPEAYIHPNALVDPGVTIGARTRIWAFAHLLSGAVIGEDCNICDQTFVEGGAIIGNRVTMKCGVYLWDGLNVSDDVFIGPNVTFVNDLRPRSRRYPKAYKATHLLQGCSIGANSTILATTIGRWSMVGAGSVVTRDVPCHTLVVGNPARFRAWLCRCGKVLNFNEQTKTNCDCGLAFEIRDKKISEIQCA
jgi:acetyltransferase-like isoleucine patch superfamily enzyme